MLYIICFIVFTLVERQLTGRTDLLYRNISNPTLGFCCTRRQSLVSGSVLNISNCVGKGCITQMIHYSWKCQYWILQTSHVNDTFLGQITLQWITSSLLLPLYWQIMRTLTLFKGYCSDQVHHGHHYVIIYYSMKS